MAKKYKCARCGKKLTQKEYGNRLCKHCTAYAKTTTGDENMLCM